MLLGLIPFQNSIPSVEMQLECPACFPFCTKTSGTQTALRLTPQKTFFGVQLKLIIKVNAGASAQLLVSTPSAIFKYFN